MTECQLSRQKRVEKQSQEIIEVNLNRKVYDNSI